MSGVDDPEKVPGSRDALELMAPRILERDPGAGHQVAHGAADEYLAWLGSGADSRLVARKTPSMVSSTAASWSAVGTTAGSSA